MKKTITFAMTLLLISFTLSAQTTKQKNNPTGRWTFDAPYAPYGYNTGTTDIGYENDTYTVKMGFTESGYSFTGEDVKLRNDSIFFALWIEGTPINMMVKINDDDTMTGNAVYFEGTVPFTMKKAVKQEE